MNGVYFLQVRNVTIIISVVISHKAVQEADKGSAFVKKKKKTWVCVCKERTFDFLSLIITGMQQ